VRVRIDLPGLDDDPIGFDEKLTLPPERLDEHVVAAPVNVHLSGNLRPVGGSYVVMGRYSATGTLSCTRCLEPVSWQTGDDFSVEYRRALPREPEVELSDNELDIAYLDDDALDLCEVAAEQVLLALPMRVVCDDECAGLCPRCGANLNTGACTCEPENDPRWDALKEIAGSETN
jgi:uncharacterized protein